MINDLEYSVVIPVLNSSKTIGKLISTIHQTLKLYTHEFICVNDNSSDDSLQKIKEVSVHTTAFINCINLTINMGQHYATAIGILQAKGKYIITIDDDLQYNPISIHLLIQEMKNSNVQIVYGLPKKQMQNAVKQILHFLFYQSSILIGKPRKKASSFRLIQRNAIQFLNNKTLHKYIYLESEFDNKIHQIGYVQVEHSNRVEGFSNYSFKKLITMYFRIVTHYVFKIKST